MATELKGSQSSVTVSQYKWLVVGMLWFVCFFNYADRQSIFSVFSVLESEFHFTKSQLGLIGSAFMWVYAGAAPFAGYIGDRFQRKTLILGGLAFWSIITAMTGWASQLRHFVTIRALEGFGEAFYFPASMSLIASYHSASTRSKAMSFHQSSVYIGTIGGGALGGYFAEKYGWRSGFYFFGLSGLVLSIVLMAWLREPPRGEPGETANAEPAPSIGTVIKDIFRTKTAVLLMLAFVGANFVAGTFLTWMPMFLKEKFDLKLAMAGLAATIFIQLASACGAPTGGWLADRFVMRHPGGRMFVQATGLILGSAFVFFTGYTVVPIALVISMIAFGFCKGLYDANIFASLYDFIPARSRATAAGVINAVGWTGAAAYQPVVGWILDRGGKANEVANMSYVISFGAAIYLLAASLLLIGALRFAKKESLILKT